MFQAQITAPRITQVVATSKKVLFPNGYPSPPPIDPTPEEQVIMREQLETRLLDLLSRRLLLIRLPFFNASNV
jgi:hypothetical protein